jgi:hypothetical protein
MIRYIVIMREIIILCGKQPEARQLNDLHNPEMCKPMQPLQTNCGTIYRSSVFLSTK